MVKKNAKVYSNFTIDDIHALGLNFGKTAHFLDNSLHIEPSDWLKQTLEISEQLPAISEKAKSENYITPILMEMKRANTQKFTFLSGCEFNVDAERGLKGFCDYILVREPHTLVIQSPILSVVEAKFDAVQSPKAMAQCCAQMYAAQQFNKKKENGISTVFGIVTNADEWLFMRLENTEILTEQHTYSRLLLPQLLGTLQQVIDFYE